MTHEKGSDLLDLSQVCRSKRQAKVGDVDQFKCGRLSNFRIVVVTTWNLASRYVQEILLRSFIHVVIYTQVFIDLLWGVKNLELSSLNFSRPRKCAA